MSQGPRPRHCLLGWWAIVDPLGGTWSEYPDTEALAVAAVIGVSRVRRHADTTGLA